MVIDVEQEKKEIINRYRKLLRKAKPILEEGDDKLIKRAFTMAAEAHKDMRRKSGEPYIYHPLAVAQICAEEIGLGTTSIIAALLHDVVEDTDIEPVRRHPVVPRAEYVVVAAIKRSSHYWKSDGANHEPQ